jgi:hypothetical protein
VENGWWQMVARRAIAAMLSIIDRKPVIDVYSDEGLKPAKVEGRIEVEAVDFSYPARPDIQVSLTKTITQRKEGYQSCRVCRAYRRSNDGARRARHSGQETKLLVYSQRRCARHTS